MSVAKSTIHQRISQNVDCAALIHPTYLQAPLLMSYMVGRETPADAVTARVVGVMRGLLNSTDGA